MESAILGVILDSSVVIEAERQQLNVVQFLKQIVQNIGEQEAALSSITVAGTGAWDLPSEHGGSADAPPGVPVYPITDNTAELVGKIGGESSAKGVTIPLDDLLIGTCALERGYAVAIRVYSSLRCPAIPRLERRQSRLEGAQKSRSRPSQ